MASMGSSTWERQVRADEKWPTLTDRPSVSVVLTKNFVPRNGRSVSASLTPVSVPAVTKGKKRNVRF